MRKLFILLLWGFLMAGLWEIIVPFDADDTNECTNPSFETGTTGYSASGTNTIAQSAEQQYRGRYSLKCTYQDNATLATLAHTFLNTGTTYYVKVKAYIPSNWNGGTLSLGSSGYASSSTTAVKTWASTPTGTWVELKSTVTSVLDLVGNLTVSTTGTPTAGRYIYLDAFYISKYDGEYFDGDEEMAYWKGTRHAAASVMDFRNRKHGKATNLDDFSVYAGFPRGFDFSNMRHNTRTRAQWRGAEYQNLTVDQRAGQLPISLVASSLTDYHTKKKAFENVVKPNKSPGTQEYVLRYLGANANTPNHLAARLDGDLALSQDGYTGIGIWRNLATEPQWYEAGDKYASLGRSSTLSVNYIVGWLNDGTGFSALGAPASSGGVPPITLAIAENGDVYIGGNFTNWDGIADADRIARYNRSTNTWSSLFAGGANNQVNKIIILDDGDLVIVGTFSSIGGSALARAARWDGSTLTGFGTGFDSQVLDVALDYKRGILYFAGGFTTANGVAANRIVRYTLATGTFTAMGTGANDLVRTIYVDETTGDVYIGGDFTTAGGNTVNRLARWNYASSAWEELGGYDQAGVDDTVYSLTGDTQGNLYIGGSFTESVPLVVTDPIPLNYIAKYRMGSDSNLEPLQSGMNGYVFFVKWDVSVNKLLLAGAFTLSDVTRYALDRTAYWNGTTFEKLPLDIPGSATVYAFARHANGDYYLTFDTTGTMGIPSALNAITNAGTDETKPVFVFDASSGTVGTDYAQLATLANRTTGKQINFNDLYILAGSIIYVDIGKGRIYRRTGQTLQDITAGVLRRDSDLSSFALQPGYNEVLLSAPDVVGTPTINAYVLYRNRHWTLSGTAV